MHRRNMAWLALAFGLPLLLISGAGPASAQAPEGEPDLTDVDPTTVMIGLGQNDLNAFPALPGGGDPLWQGAALVFPADPDGSAGDGFQVYRSVAASLQAALPECHTGTAEVTVSVRVANDGPNSGFVFTGRFLLLEPGDPELWFERIYDQQNPASSAPPGYVETLTLSASVPAEDLAAGDVFIHLSLETYHSGGQGNNTGTQWTADQFSATYAFDTTGCEPQIAIEKSGTGPDPLQVGDTVDYSFVVTNTGDLTLTNVTVTDPLPGMSPIDCPNDTLDPAAEMTCTATYTVTQEDVDTGFIENTATVTGDPPDGPSVSAEDFAVVPPSQKPGISVEKSGSGPDPLEVGATIDYTFLVTNTGNVTLNDVTITDPLPGLSPISCPDTTLASGAEMTCTATYTVTQDDVDAGSVENTATVTGTPPGNLPPPTDESTTTVPPTQGSGISIEKSGSGPDPLVVGATIDYTFVVTNTGNVTLTDVVVTDPLPGLSPIDCPGTTLAPGAEMTCTASYEVTQADVDAGVVENTATVTGETPTGGPPPTDESTTTVPPTPPVPALPPLAFVLLLALLATATLWTLRRARA